MRDNANALAVAVEVLEVPAGGRRALQRWTYCSQSYLSS